MKKTTLVATLAVLVAHALGAQLPDTPAGRQFAAWTKARESGDTASLQQYLDKYMPWGRVPQEFTMVRQTGGYDVKKILESSDTRVVVLAQERGPAKQFARIELSVGAAAPNVVEGIGIQRADPPPELAPAKMTAVDVANARNEAPFRQFSAWLGVFNGGNRDSIQRYLRTNYPSMTVDAQMNLRGRTGGFEFRGLEQANARSVVGFAQERSSDQFVRFIVVVDSAAPHAITRFNVAPAPPPPEFAPLTLSEGDLVVAVRTQLEKEAAADRFAGTALIGRIGSETPVFSGAYGLADREKKIANTLDTRFRIGSMNKMVTAVAILQLVQAGKIKLMDPLGKFLTDYPNKDVAKKVTIHHLLTHTGGTGDIFGPQYEANRLSLRTLGDYVALYGNRALGFEPGSRWSYSNYGMLLLGVVVERVSGKSYYDYVAENIYRPAGMTRTASEPEDVAVAGRSVGYMRQGGSASWTVNTETLPYRGTSAGGGYSTVGDLLRFANALMGHKLLDATHTNLLITGKVDVAGGRKYAYGFEDARTGSGAGAVGHGGGAPGMNGELRIFPKTGYVVAVLSNLDPPAATLMWSFIDARLPR